MSVIDPDWRARIDLNKSLAENRLRVALPVLMKLIEMKGEKGLTVNAERMAEVAVDYADALLVEVYRKGKS